MTGHDAVRDDDVLDDDVLQELQAELRTVTPSPEFAARVRARIATASPVRRPRFWIWLTCAATVTVAAVVVSRRTPEHVTPVTAVTSSAPAPTEIRQEPAVIARAPETSRPSPRVPHTVRAPAADPRLEVITTQSEVLDQLWRAAFARRSGRPVADGELPALTVLVDSDGMMLVPELVVNPIVVPPIGPASGGQGRVQRVLSPQATGSPR